MEDTKECTNYDAKIDDFDLKLKKFFGVNGTKYCLNICCPQIVYLTNDCPRELISFRIPKCIQSNGVMYEVNGPVSMTYTNGTNGANGANVIERGDNQFILIMTDTICKKNKLCITNVTIPVQPYCLDCSKCYTVPFNNTGRFVCLETDTLKNCIETFINRILVQNNEAPLGVNEVLSLNDARRSVLLAAINHYKSRGNCAMVIEQIVGDGKKNIEPKSICDTVLFFEQEDDATQMAIKMDLEECKNDIYDVEETDQE